MGAEKGLETGIFFRLGQIFFSGGEGSGVEVAKNSENFLKPFGKIINNFFLLTFREIFYFFPFFWEFFFILKNRPNFSKKNSISCENGVDVE